MKNESENIQKQIFWKRIFQQRNQTKEKSKILKYVALLVVCCFIVMIIVIVKVVLVVIL